WRPLLWALGPPLALYAFHNWDLSASFLAALGLLLFARGKAGWAGAVLALGFYAKIYPALFLPLLGMELLRRDGGLRRDGWRFGLAAVGTLAAVAAPLLVLAPARFVESFAFHARRGPTIESAWNGLRHFASQAGWDGVARFLAGAGVAILSNALILFFLVLLATAVRRGRLHWLHACLGMVAAFLLFNQVMSMQYALWVLPLLVLVRVPWWGVGAFLAADAACYYTVLDYFGHEDTAHFEAMAMASLARAAAYALLLGWVLWGLRRPASTRTAPPADSLTWPAAPPESNR
ncbi:MAG: hypothetical protein QOI63_551, partial [Thermoplasmata archaeon]|nr:hypothetical protein [Thermoplasmata archaeon]